MITYASYNPPQYPVRLRPLGQGLRDVKGATKQAEAYAYARPRLTRLTCQWIRNSRPSPPSQPSRRHAGVALGLDSAPCDTGP